MAGQPLYRKRHYCGTIARSQCRHPPRVVVLEIGGHLKSEQYSRSGGIPEFSTRCRRHRAAMQAQDEQLGQTGVLSCAQVHDKASSQSSFAVRRCGPVRGLLKTSIPQSLCCANLGCVV
jgi:hypothetical protein